MEMVRVLNYFKKLLFSFYIFFYLLGNGKTRRSRDYIKQTSNSTSESEDEFMGATTRRAWTDICKVPSSHSEDETNDKKKKLNKSKKTVAAKKAVAKGRIRKPKLKRPLKISGLDLLHSQTLFSTSDQAIGIRLPAAAGCIDEQLTNYAGTMTHEELDVPDPSTEPPYGLKILLDVYKTQFMNFLENMRSASFK